MPASTVEAGAAVQRLEPDPDRLARPRVHRPRRGPPGARDEGGGAGGLQHDRLGAAGPRRSPAGDPPTTSWRHVAKKPAEAVAAGRRRGQRDRRRADRRAAVEVVRRRRGTGRQPGHERVPPGRARRRLHRHAAASRSPPGRRAPSAPDAGAVSVPSGFDRSSRGRPRGRRRTRRSARVRRVAPEHGQRTPRPLDQVQDGLPVAPGLGRDQRVFG